MKILGFPGGMLKDGDDMKVKMEKLKPTSKLTLMGVAEGKELKESKEKTVFVEDLTD